MRRAMAAITVMLAAACAHPDGSARSNWPTPSAASDMRITPANIRRVARDLPGGYEVTGLAAATTPAAIWGVGRTGRHIRLNARRWPTRCAAVANPRRGVGVWFRWNRLRGGHDAARKVCAGRPRNNVRMPAVEHGDAPGGN
ncbi:hypothetical protein I552_1642 [Mycobacterium xenopi 3993]|nr:hypothetical protein I552_1642 [Mycobacterium xenopi 3993]